MIKRRIIIAAGISCAAAVCLWIIVDIIFNGTIRNLAYNELLDQFSQGWEHFRLFLYVIFALLFFLLILVYFIVPDIVIYNYKQHEQEKLKKYVISYFNNKEIPDIDKNYAELKEVLLTQRLHFEESEKKRNELISNIAHDLRTPLTSVIGYLTLLQDDLKIPEDIRKKYIGICYDKAEQMNVLLSDFFELSRYVFETVELNKSVIDLTQLIDQLADEFYPMLEKNGLKIKFNCNDSVYYYCDGNRLSRAFENIIRNAIDYSDGGEPINIDMLLSNHHITVTVSNRCKPVSKSQLSRIFERSYRTDSSRNKPGHGGLGLSIAKEIIEAHDGEVSAGYSDGRFTVKVILPQKGA